MGETNLEKVLDTKADEAGLQLSEKDLTEKFSDKANRVTLVNEATKGFEGLDDKTKTEIKDKAATEIKSRANYPVKGEEGYNAKIAVLYLYTTLSKGTKNASLDEVKTTYNELIAADVQEKQETTAKLEAGKKEATAVLTTKLDEYTKTKDLYSAANWEAVVYSATNGEKEITAAKTLEEVTAAKDLALKSMDNVFTLEEEKAAELKKVIDDKKNEQKEITDKPVEYTEQNGKRGHYTEETVKIPSISALKGGASYDAGISAMPVKFFNEDPILTQLMEDGNAPEIFSDEKMFNYITKNYASLSKNEEINEVINEEIIHNLSVDADLKPKSELTGVKLQINDKTGEYYFDVPVSNLKEGKKANKGVNSIHVYFNANEKANNVIVNEGEEKKDDASTISTGSTTEDFSNEDTPGMMDDGKNVIFNTGKKITKETKQEEIEENTEGVLTRNEPLIEGSENDLPGTMFDDVGGTATENKSKKFDKKDIKTGFDKLTDDVKKGFKNIADDFAEKIKSGKTQKIETNNDLQAKKDKTTTTETKPDVSSETIQELPTTLSGIKNSGTRKKTGETYVMTPNTSVQYSQLNPFMTNELSKIENNGFDVAYMSEGGNLSKPITSIEFTPKNKKDAIVENTKKTE